MIDFFLFFHFINTQSYFDLQVLKDKICGMTKIFLLDTCKISDVGIFLHQD